MSLEIDAAALPLYDLRGVQKRYGSGDTLVTAVAGIDLRIHRGEFVVIAGPSGSGKTTLLQLLGALDRPTGGEVLFEGQELNRMGDNALARLRRETLGFVFQQFNLIPTLTAQQNVEAAMPDRKGGARREHAQELLERVGLGHRLNADGLTVVLITHDPTIAGAAKRVVRMQDGHLAAAAAAGAPAG
jgi:putative ABC transport system ATP-binding protein